MPMKVFNLSESHFLQLLKQNISLNHLYILEMAYENTDLVSSDVKYSAIIQGLQRKNLLSKEGKITEEGKKLYNSLFENAVEIRVAKLAVDREGIGALHKKLEDKIMELKGRKQMRVDVLGTKYSFLPNERDLIDRLVGVISKYKLTDFDRIEKTLLSYIENCNRRNSWTPLLQYYIEKNSQSRMVTDYNNLEEKEEKEQNTMLI